MSIRRQSAARSRGGRRALLVPLVATGALLAGCGIHPGDAATVGGYSITRDSLDDYTQGQCAFTASSAAASQQGGQAADPVPRSLATRAVLEALIHARQQIRYGRANDVDIDRDILRQQRTQLQDTLSKTDLSSSERRSVLGFNTLSIEGQLVALGAGLEDLGVPLSQSVINQAVTRGEQIITRWTARNGADVSVDPRYNLSVEDGQPKLRDGSVSLPVSSAAKQSLSQQPSQGVTAALPVTQRCG